MSLSRGSSTPTGADSGPFDFPRPQEGTVATRQFERSGAPRVGSLQDADPVSRLPPIQEKPGGVNDAIMALMIGCGSASISSLPRLRRRPPASRAVWRDSGHQPGESNRGGGCRPPRECGGSSRVHGNPVRPGRSRRAAQRSNCRAPASGRPGPRPRQRGDLRGRSGKPAAVRSDRDRGGSRTISVRETFAILQHQWSATPELARKNIDVAAIPRRWRDRAVPDGPRVAPNRLPDRRPDRAGRGVAAAYARAHLARRSTWSATWRRCD